MPTTDPRVDAYIAKAAPFAQPILTHLRAVVHEAVPEVEEAMKWGRPHFLLGGGILCGMSAFKAHCAFGFWDGAAVVPDAPSSGTMGEFGRLGTLDDLPPREVLLGYVRRAAELREAGVPRTHRPSRAERAPLVIPEVVTAALATNDAACATFEAFPPSHRREYVEWIVEARTEATRDRRIAQMLEWLAEGKSRNWKYERRG